MTFLKKPFKFGDKELPSNILYAPLAGCSDFPYRQMSARYQPGIIYCEMVKMDALVRGDSGTFKLLDYSHEMHPIGGQLVGSNVAAAGPAAKIIEDLGFDVVDFNCGCPVDKVTKDGSGSGMLRTPEKIGEILSEMVAHVSIPVTVKIRAGWDESSINAVEITKIAEQAGAKAICIHGRTRKQGYSGPANWEWIRECKEAAKDILVIGNGDVTSGEAAEKMFQQTGCDAVLVARGTMGRPWIVAEIIDYLEGTAYKEKTFEEMRDMLREHFSKVVDYEHDKKAVTDARRIGCWYLKSAPGTKAFRQKMSRVESVEEALAVIEEYPLGHE